MKTTLCLVAAIAWSGSAVVQVAETDTNKIPVSVVQPLETATIAQDVIEPPVPADEQAAATQISPSDQAAIETQSVVDQTVQMDPTLVEYPPAMAAPMLLPPVAQCCTTCCQPTCCCPPPPPTPTVFCLVDTCGCSHQACIRVPACCADEQPRISWRKGILGRQIATLCWDCCGHRATVIITCFGKVRVRD